MHLPETEYQAMLFNSLEFIIFFPIVTILYFLIPYSYRWLHLLVASCIFYMAFIPVYILILFVTIGIDYYAGIQIEGASPEKKKPFLILSLIANVGVLAVFKYYNFFIDNMNALLDSLHIQHSMPLLSIILPIGLSFHTFQAISYTIEVYRGNQKAERHLGVYALYVMYYPQLVAGPIERPQNILHRFYEKHDFDYRRVVSGLQLMAWGMFKKVVIADRLSMFVNNVYSTPDQYDGVSIAFSTCCFAIQIYCDFSGYSDIALGASEVMGIKLMRNFRQPYFSKNIGEFWSRWHMSLSTWFRDYVYIPLGGNRVSRGRLFFNLSVVFMLSGLWHGANWTFVVWGALHAVFQITYLLWTQTNISRILQEKIPAWIHDGLGLLLTFSMVCVAWIFFRAETIGKAWVLVKNLTKGWDVFVLKLMQGYGFLSYFILGNELKELILAVVFVVLLFVVDYFCNRYESVRTRIGNMPLAFRWSLYYGVLICIYCYGIFNQSGFIYFQF